MRSAVCNASPLIILAKSELLWLVPKLFSEVFVPRAVVDEVLAGSGDDPIHRQFSRLEWIRTVELHPGLSPLSTWQLGRGEAEVLEYARLNSGLIALLDDRAARRAAKVLGVQVCGTLGVLALAVRSGLVESFPESVRTLRAAGLYVSEELVAAVQRGLGGEEG